MRWVRAMDVNDRFDKGYYVVEGAYTFVIAGEAVQVAAGGWVYVPRDVAHAWRCDSATGRVLNVVVPGGFEEFYRAVGEPVQDREHLPAVRDLDVESVSRIAREHGNTITGPPPAG